MKRITQILNLLYGLIVLLFLLDSMTSFDIKSQFLKTLVYFGFLVGTPIILFWNLVFVKTKTRRIVGMVYPAIFLILIFVLNPIVIVFSSGAWQTQEILYQNREVSFKKIEFQMQNIGAMGYNRRTVEVVYLTPLFMITSEAPKDFDKSAEWKKVDKNVNELQLR
ncbi:MAG TPA: hypothetical protein VFT78_06045 [Hanamia sp.]|nr:hypothetical protein [Hanamia sp.]